MVHAPHHFKAYLFFLAFSVILIGVLVYLYFPPEDTASLQANTIVSSEVESKEPETSDASKVPSSDSVRAERMKLTALLLRYQKKLVEAEARKDTSEVIQSLKIKIAQLEKMIQDLATQ